MLIFWILYHWFTFKTESVMLTKKQAFNFYKSVICPMFRCNFKKLLDFSQFSKKTSFVIDRHWKHNHPLKQNKMSLQSCQWTCTKLSQSGTCCSFLDRSHWRLHTASAPKFGVENLSCWEPDLQRIWLSLIWSGCDRCCPKSIMPPVCQSHKDQAAWASRKMEIL